MSDQPDGSDEPGVQGEPSESHELVPVEQPGTLKPIPEWVTPEVRQFTETLRGLFNASGTSLGRLAAEMYYNKGTVSRYLSGARMPPREFVEKLLRVCFDVREAPVTAEVEELVTRQRLAALKSSEPALYKIEVLTEQLTLAQTEKRAHDSTIRLLQNDIGRLQTRIYDLEREKRQVLAAWQDERQRSDDTLDEETAKRDILEQAIRGLAQQVAELSAQLAKALGRADAAEDRCRILEAQIDTAALLIEDADSEEAAPPVPPSSAPVRRRPTSSSGSVVSAWLYQVNPDGKASPILDEHGQHLAKTVKGEAVLHISAVGGQDTLRNKHLKAPPADGMASEAVTVRLDEQTGYWMIRNSGRTNTLRVQQYGLGAVPLNPGAMIPMAGEDVAVWIPVRPSRPHLTDKSEAFRLLILKVPPVSWVTDGTKFITAPRRLLTPRTQEALIAYFGPHLCWPPLVAPHVRSSREVEDIASAEALARVSPGNWARSGHDVLAGRDGLFNAADWYPTLGGPSRTIANHLAAFYRLVELRTISLRRVVRWAEEHDVRPFVYIDRQLVDLPMASEASSAPFGAHH